MPYIRIEMLEGRSDEQKAKLVHAITHAMMEHAGAKPESLNIVIEDVKKSNWAVAGVLISQKK